MPNEILSLKNISKNFGDIQVLKSLDLTVNEGDFITIIGKSGSGKSTLLNIISTFDFASSGEYTINGEIVSIKESSKYAKLRNEIFGFVFQSYCLVPKLSVIDNICLPLIYKNKEKVTINAEKRLKDLISLLKIEHIKDRKIDCLSGGEKQRVALARALINNPKILIADEPTGNLDEESAKIIFDLLYKLNKSSKLTIILVTHSNQNFEEMSIVKRLENGTLN